MQKQAEQKKVESEYHRKELLIEQARLAYAKKQSGVTEAPATTVTCKFCDESSCWESILTRNFDLVDVESPDFDLEKYIEHIEKESN